MNRFSLSRLPGVSRSLLAVFATGAVFTAGCANMATTATGSSPMDSGGSLTGRIHGGNQPVAFATVYLYAAGEGPDAGGSPAYRCRMSSHGRRECSRLYKPVSCRGASPMVAADPSRRTQCPKNR